MKPSVYVTRQLPAAALDRLREHCRVEINPEDRVLTHEELLAGVHGRDAVLCLLTDAIDDAVLAAAGPSCRIFANYAVGFNNIDVAAAIARHIIVTNTPGVLTDATADLAWALLFAAARRIVEADAYNRARRFTGWGPMLFLGADITGRTLGVIGAGRIGSNFAKKSVGFDMKVLYHDLRRNPEFEADTGAVFVPLETLLGEADFVSVHVPLLPETRHLLGAREFALMKSTAILVNTSRGPVVDEEALVCALQAGEIAGAGLDVYEAEPAMAPGLAELPNAVLVPHIASATVETRTRMGLMAVENILAVFAGDIPPNCVNPEVLE